MSKEAEKYIEKYTTKDQNDWLVQKKDIVAKFMQAYADEQNKKLIKALKEISEGKGSYDMDALKHCSNTVRDMKQIAIEALKQIEK